MARVSYSVNDQWRLHTGCSDAVYLAAHPVPVCDCLPLSFENQCKLALEHRLEESSTHFWGISWLHLTSSKIGERHK